MLLASPLQATRVRRLASSHGSIKPKRGLALCTLHSARESVNASIMEETARRPGQMQTPLRLLAGCTGNLSPVPSPWKIRPVGGCQWHQAQRAHQGRGVGLSILAVASGPGRRAGKGALRYLRASSLRWPSGQGGSSLSPRRVANEVHPQPSRHAPSSSALTPQCALAYLLITRWGGVGT